MKFDEKLINLRKEKGLSQEEFGNILEVSRQSVSKWELGQTQPDVDKIKKICEFYNISFDYLLNDNIEEKKLLKDNDKIDENTYNIEIDNLEKRNEEKENFLNIEKNEREIKKEYNEPKKQKNKLIIFLQIVLFIILLAYTINSVFKAVVFSNILENNDMDNIESYKYNSTVEKEYIFNEMKDENVYNTMIHEYICYKDNIFYVWTYYDDDEENCMYWEQYWNYYNKRFDKKGYNVKTKIKDAIWTYEYYYRDEGNFLRQLTTFKFINDELKEEFSIANILNPFKFYKITEDGNIIIERFSNDNYKYSKNIYYIDIKSGFLSKEEWMQNDEIVEKTIYQGYEINCVEDEDLMFDEKLKQEIIDKSAITYEENLRKAEKLNNEILNKTEST